MRREIVLYGKYFMEFYRLLSKPVQGKIDYVFELIKKIEFIPQRFFKHIEGTDGLYEIRVEYESNIYRIFCFFDKGNIVVLINAFQKKTQKTPTQEIRLAVKLKKQYFIDKNYIDNEKRKKT